MICDMKKVLYQQAKIKWLCEGDKNSRFFHSVLKGRKCKNKVHSIIDNASTRHEGDQIPQVFLNHFQEFLGTSHPVQDIEYVETLFKKRLRVKEEEKMTSEISNKEIKEALFDTEDSKVPSPNGFSLALFKKAWNVVGIDVCNVVKEFFNSEKLLGELNATLISLIHKVQTPNKVTDFRPIACCNVLYKCITDLIVTMKFACLMLGLCLPKPNHNLKSNLPQEMILSSKRCMEKPLGVELQEPHVKAIQSAESRRSKPQGLRGAKKLKYGSLYLYVGNGVRAEVEAIGSFDLVWGCEVERISKKKTKNEAKNDKTGHGMEKRGKDTVKGIAMLAISLFSITFAESMAVINLKEAQGPWMAGMRALKSLTEETQERRAET
ncbi:hypothetical protein Tco_0156476 [Tanacetum coccineum]